MTSAQRPKQAVILAGGLGTRLGDITKTRPKPLAPIDGVPFLAYLLAQLREQGIERVLLLLGYMADMIVDYCGDGGRFGLRVDYSIGAVEDDTGARLRRARSELDPLSLLMYCDNYWPLPLQRMCEAFGRTPEALAQITVYANSDGRTRSNLKVGDDGRVIVYDKTRNAPGLAGVDIGFILLRREALDLLPATENCSFEATVYSQLVSDGRLTAFVSEHHYYSIGSPDRLAETERFLCRRSCVIVDRDGVLNAKARRGEYIATPAGWRWLPGAVESLRQLEHAGIDTLVVTNQAGIARGMVTPDALTAIHARMCAEAEAGGGHILDVIHCPHHWDEGCSCRKPKPGMLFDAQHRHLLDLSRTPFIGDDPRDGQAAAAADEPFFAVNPEEGLAEAMPAVLDFIHNRGQGLKPIG